MSVVTLNNNDEVFKVIHESGNETCVKTVDAISTTKSTVFISSSVGCPLKCKFCHLTIKDIKYRKLEPSTIREDTLYGIKYAASETPKIGAKDIKLSWMGMGDAFFNLQTVLDVSGEILTSSGTKGLDKIDISTALPSHTSDVDMETYSRVVEKYGERKVRLFYSLFSANRDTRNYMIPNTHTIEEAVNLFRSHGVRVIAHQIFIDGVNDSAREVEELVDFVNRNADVFTELRVLRYNSCGNSWWYESVNYDGIMSVIHETCKLPIKSQVSPGKEIQAACGMFHDKK